MDNNRARLRVAQPATYCIQVQGVLDESWADHFGGLTIRQVQSAGQFPLTVLTGQVPDQVRLLAILHRLCELGLPVRSVKWLEQ